MSESVLWTSNHALQATVGECRTEWEATSVEIDSRAVKEGSLFIALLGENHDAHLFVQQALDNGAAAAIVQYIPVDVPQDAPLFIVDDTMEALVNLALYKREKTSAHVIGVTGSVAKTSTKEMIRFACEALGKTHANVGNFNNHYGVPLSVARMPDDTEYAVFEMGMNHAGEISQLTSVVRPHVAVVTAVEVAHMEFFEDITAIAEAKSEIFDGVDYQGTAVINHDSPLYGYVKRKAADKDVTSCVSYGQNQESTCRVVDYHVDDKMHSSVQVSVGAAVYDFELSVIGRHHACNAAGALAVLYALNEDIDKALTGLANFIPSQGRGVWHELSHEDGVYHVLDDCYNANPASMRAALSVLSECNGRKVAILADMLELGNDSSDIHAALLQDILDARIDLVYTVGPLMKHLYDVLPAEKSGQHFNDVHECEDVLHSIMQVGDVLLLKGSNGMKLHSLLQTLLPHKHVG